MSERRGQEVADKARQAFRALLEGFEHLRGNDPGNAGWTLLGYAEHQVELLDARLKRLGVDTSLGLDPVYLLPGARLPAGDKQAITLRLAVFEARRWSTIYYSGVRALHIAVGEEALAKIVASYRRRPIPVSREVAELMASPTITTPATGAGNSARCADVSKNPCRLSKSRRRCGSWSPAY